MRPRLVLLAPVLLLVAGFAPGCGGSAPTEPTAPTITAEHLRAMPAEEADSLSTRQNLAQPRNVKLVGRF
jgi:hypothetical protein